MKSTKVRSVIVALAAVIVIVSLGACGHTAATLPTYRIGLGPWVGFGPLYLAQEKGFFEQQGIRAELIVLTGLAEHGRLFLTRAPCRPRPLP